MLAFNFYRGLTCTSQSLTGVPALPCGCFPLRITLRGLQGLFAVSCVRLVSTSYQVGAPCCYLLAAYMILKITELPASPGDLKNEQKLNKDFYSDLMLQFQTLELQHQKASKKQKPV